jgi:C-terminal processing protease CtpA/Prc
MRHTRCERIAVAVMILFAVGCGSGHSPIPTAPSTISPAASAYLDRLLELMQTRSLHRSTISWPEFRSEVRSSAGAAQTIPDLFVAIRTAIKLLGDGHSFYQTPTGGTIAVPTRTCVQSGAGPPTLPPTVGYVKVGAFTGSGAASIAFADGLQTAIQNSDRDDLVGWIVDLRGNTGGNMWPMIAGLGPVLGEGTLGFFIDPVDGIEFTWEYRNGIATNGGQENARVTAPYRLRKGAPRVAVLYDNAVASSGEATAVAFRRRPNTRSFGTPTCGLSTANLAFPLSDGASLYLTVSVMVDRARTIYGDSIEPDELISDRTQVADRAVAWLTQ